MQWTLRLLSTNLTQTTNSVYINRVKQMQHMDDIWSEIQDMPGEIFDMGDGSFMTDEDVAEGERILNENDMSAFSDASLEYDSIDAGPCRNFGADRHLVFSTHLGCRTADDPPQLDDLYRF